MLRKFLERIRPMDKSVLIKTKNLPSKRVTTTTRNRFHKWRDNLRICVCFLAKAIPLTSSFCQFGLFGSIWWRSRISENDPNGFGEFSGKFWTFYGKKSSRNWLIACERRRISAFRVRNWVGKQQQELRLRSITLYMLFITNPWCVQTTVLAHAWKVENLMYQLLQHQQPRLLLHLDYLVHLDLSPGKRTNLSQFIMHITLSCNRF